ncbi:hypothetical protein LCGC14_0965060 [marine sediment metagenome]|uniref:Uncharacterized protein n=1 Tax=marine sediment metagenome TaxID=412755 RepID=A0A0F9QWL7_9ZZZZ
MTTKTKDTEITLKTTKVYEAILQAMKDGKKGILLEGGTYSSKTWSALQALYVVSTNSPNKLDIDIVSESVPHLKGGCIKDFFNILNESPENNPRYNQTDHIYREEGGKGVMTFLSADNEKALGMRRDILFINEGDTLSWEIAKELISRTNIFIIIDWNPRSEFWAHEYYLNDPKWAYDHSTYLDALDVIPFGKREDIEDLGRKDPNYQNIYELGLLGKIEGLVHPHFTQIDVLPEGRYFYGLDFGFGSFNPLQLQGGDPTVLVRNIIVGENLYSKEMFYKYEAMTNDDIAREMVLLKINPLDPIYPDPNEPKSAEEIRRKGFNVQETERGPGSVSFGIKRVNSFYQFWTEDSLKCIKDQRNYRYLKKKEPRSGSVFLSNDTTHQWSHCLIAGTMIKTRRGRVPIESVTTEDYVMTRQGWKKVIASGMTSLAERVQTIFFSNGSNVTGTPDHLVYTKNRGFIPLNTCRYADIIEVCERHSFTMTRSIIGILNHLIGLTGCISGQDQRQSGISIAKYGLIIMERYLKEVKSITRMITPLITQFKTLSAYLKDGTSLIIPVAIQSGGVSGCELISGNTRRRLISGTLPQKDKLGIGNWGNYLGIIENQQPMFVNNAERNIGRDNQTQKQDGFALINVNRHTAERQGKMILRRLVGGAVKLSRRVNINRGNAAPVSVLSVSEFHKDHKPVYDLTIGGLPEFYANGILVHNSMDARRYAVASSHTSRNKYTTSTSIRRRG